VPFAKGHIHSNFSTTIINDVGFELQKTKKEVYCADAQSETQSVGKA
jgi:hypothetical protein